MMQPFEKDYIAKDGTRVPVLLGALIPTNQKGEFAKGEKRVDTQKNSHRFDLEESTHVCL